MRCPLAHTLFGSTGNSSALISRPTRRSASLTKLEHFKPAFLLLWGAYRLAQRPMIRFALCPTCNTQNKLVGSPLIAPSPADISRYDCPVRPLWLEAGYSALLRPSQLSGGLFFGAAGRGPNATCRRARHRCRMVRNKE